MFNNIIEIFLQKKKKEKAANQFRNFFTKKKGSPKIKVSDFK